LIWEASYEANFKVPKIKIKGSNVEEKSVSDLGVRQLGQYYGIQEIRRFLQQNQSSPRQALCH
jgi:hypothetical protein